MKIKLAILLLALFSSLHTCSQVISVSSLTVTGIVVATNTPIIIVCSTSPCPAGSIAIFSAVVQRADGSLGIDVTQQCQWSSSNPAVATMVGSVATGINTGSSVISCSYNGITSTANLTVSVIPLITNPNSGTCITPCPLTAGVNGTPYSYTFTATGGTLPYTWTVSAGAIPGWATLNSSTGALTGTPNINTTTNFTIQVTDSSVPTNFSTTLPVAITISATGCASGGSYNPPLSYCGTISTAVDTWPNLPPQSLIGLVGQNNVATETSTIGLNNFSWPLYRATDSTTSIAGSRQYSASDTPEWSCQTPSGGCGVGNYFFTTVRNTGGNCDFFQWNSTTRTVTTMGTAIGTANGGYSFTCDGAHWSYKLPSTFYSVGNAAGVSWNPAPITAYAVNFAATTPWTSSAITATPILDPTGTTDPCNSLGLVNTALWNKYGWGVGSDVGVSAGDSGGSATGMLGALYGYAQDQKHTFIVFDGTQTVGKRCSWFDSLTGQTSINGGTPQAVTGGYAPLAAPIAPIVTPSASGGTLLCGNWVVAITYTIAGVGESLPSPPTSFNTGGSGSTCSFTVTAPSSTPTIGGFVSGTYNVGPTGYNVYSAPCLPSCQTRVLSIINNSPTSTLAQPAAPTVTSTVCSAGSTTYTYYIEATATNIQSVPSKPTSIGLCPTPLTGVNFITVNWTTVPNATGYKVCRDFLTACILVSGGSTVTYKDVGTIPFWSQVQTNLIANNATITSVTNFGFPAPTVGTAGMLLHGVQTSKSGRWIDFATTDASCQNCKLFWDRTTGVVITSDTSLTPQGQVNPTGSHGALTFDQFVAGSFEFTFGPLMYTFNDSPTVMQASQTQLNSQPTQGLQANVNFYVTYPFAVDGDFLYYVNSPTNANYALPTTVWDGETIGFPTASFPNLPNRFFRTWASGGNGFGAGPRTQCTIDGKWCLFATDFARNSAGTSACLNPTSGNPTCGFGGYNTSTQATSTACTPSQSGSTSPFCRPEVLIVPLQ